MVGTIFNLNIIQIIDYLNSQSSEGKRLINISNNLVKKGNKVTILTSTDDGINRVLVDGVNIINLNSIFRHNNLSINPNFLNFNFNYCDLIHTHSYRTFSTTFLGILNKKIKKPIILSPYGSISYSNKGKIKYLYKIQDRLTQKRPIILAKKIIAETIYEKNEIIKFGSSKDKIEVVYRDVDTNLFKRIDKIESNIQYIVYIGRITRIKGIDLLLTAVSRLKIPFKLLIIGPILDYFYYKELLDLIIKHKLGSKIIFLGEINNEKIPFYCSIASVLVLPSIYENLGGIIMEAQSCECPVIASRIGGIPEVMQDGQTGFLLDSRNPSELTQKIEILIRDDGLRKQFGKSAREFIINNFTADKFNNKIIKIYENSLI